MHALWIKRYSLSGVIIDNTFYKGQFFREFFISFLAPIKDVQFFNAIGAKFQIFTPSLMTIDLSCWEPCTSYILQSAMDLDSLVDQVFHQVPLQAVMVLNKIPPFKITKQEN